jgi:hypothetical protein
VRQLLRLGRKGFAPQLLAYLSAYPPLLWLAQAAGGQWDDAAATLLVAAQGVQVRAARAGAGSGRTPVVQDAACSHQPAGAHPPPCSVPFSPPRSRPAPLRTRAPSAAA